MIKKIFKKKFQQIKLLKLFSSKLSFNHPLCRPLREKNSNRTIEDPRVFKEFL